MKAQTCVHPGRRATGRKTPLSSSQIP
jgi:hypothetical protein